ncbi:hypothetical protein BVY02_01365 [bacterium J17]|nr:hypothetical protein BVY02_01365 [bacterium J17]
MLKRRKSKFKRPRNRLSTCSARYPKSEGAALRLGASLRCLVLFGLAFFVYSLAWPGSSALSERRFETVLLQEDKSLGELERAKSVPNHFARESRQRLTSNKIDQDLLSNDFLKVNFSVTGRPSIKSAEDFSSLVTGEDDGKFFSQTHDGSRLYYSFDLELQRTADELLRSYSVPWGAIVAMDPKTGRVLAASSYSSAEPSAKDLVTQADFNAASLFKIVTAAAVVEEEGMAAEDKIFYRGGNYTLSRRNYLPDSRRDRRSMSLEDALAKSCNPAFGRLGLDLSSKHSLLNYAEQFGFNRKIPFEVPVQVSRMNIGNDAYNLARTAAGFGQVKISPLHAAMIAAGIANEGTMMRPFFLDKIVNKSGQVVYESAPAPWTYPILSSTADELMDMMQLTIDKGTARRVFRRYRSGLLRDIEIAAKTGTLRGKDKRGTNHWFVAALPANDPEIAIAVLVVDPGGARINGSALGGKFLNYYYKSKKTRA